MSAGYVSVGNTQEIDHICNLVLDVIFIFSKRKTFRYHLCNVGPMSKTLGRRCINVIQMAWCSLGLDPRVNIQDESDGWHFLLIQCT